MDIFNALADPTRRSIIRILADHGQLSATDIYCKFDVSSPAISQHLKVLRNTNLVFVEKQAQKRLYTINPNAILELEEWAKQTRLQWDERFNRLDKLSVNLQ